MLAILLSSIANILQLSAAELFCEILFRSLLFVVSVLFVLLISILLTFNKQFFSELLENRFSKCLELK